MEISFEGTKVSPKEVEFLKKTMASFVKSVKIMKKEQEGLDVVGEKEDIMEKARDLADLASSLSRTVGVAKAGVDIIGSGYSLYHLYYAQKTIEYGISSLYKAGLNLERKAYEYDCHIDFYKINIESWENRQK